MRKVRDAAFLFPLLSHQDAELQLAAQAALKAMEWEPQTIEQQVALVVFDGDRAHVARLGPPAIPALGRLLAESKSPELRAHAADALGRIGDAGAIEALAAALGDESDWVRRTSALALGEIADPRAVPALAAHLANPKSGLSGPAATALRKIGKAGGTALCLALADKAQASRWQLAQYLGELGDPAAAAVLADAVREPDELLQREAAIALGRLKDPRGLGPLLRMSADGDFACEAVVLIEGILKAAAAGVALPELRAAAALSARQTIREDAPGFGGDHVSGAERVDCSGVKALATAELARRGGR